MNQAGDISDRQHGELVVSLELTGPDRVYQSEEICRVALENIYLHEGPGSRTITLDGRKSVPHAAQTIILSGVCYKNISKGKVFLQLAAVHPYLRAGDTVSDGTNTIVVGAIEYFVSPQYCQMGITEL